MSYRRQFTQAARSDIERLYRFLAEQDIPAAEAAMAAIDKGLELLREFPFAARKADEATPFLRELVISFGSAGYVALFEIESDTAITALAMRHDREEDYH